MTFKHYGALAALAFAAACGSDAPDVDLPGLPDTGSTEKPVPEPAPSPEPALKNAYFGDLHIHTANSFDAFIFGTRASPDDAYNFAKGQTIKHDGGYDIKLAGPPLDFLAVTDHGEYMGVVPAMADPEHPIGQTEIAKAVFGPDAQDPAAAFAQVGYSFVTSEPIEELYDTEFINSIWRENIAAAERHNDPGQFTAFSGYEFTSMNIVTLEDPVAAANLHRNVIFKDSAPTELFSTLNSRNPEDLWDWMDAQRAAGNDVMAIPHNSNASNGEMFALESWEGNVLDEEYAVQRLRNEPLIEITQIKGTSETHPSLSPNDEFANHEIYEYFIGSTREATVNLGDYARPALARGMALAKEIGANPYKFGFIGASDTHVGAATLEEATHHGKFPTDGASPEARNSVPPDGAKTWEGAPSAEGRLLAGGEFSASGLAGVWATENTRAAIYDAMARKETFGTSGPRMRVHLKAAAVMEVSADDPSSTPRLVEEATVVMGGEYVGSTAPYFEATALRDPNSAPLQRMQMIKVWNEDGAPKEAIFDIACASGDPVDGRCAGNGASVDTATCEASGTGAGQLSKIWQDPAYDPAQEAAYYVRVLENPTCRWSTWDAVRNGTPPNPDLDLTVQERAWTSPIWVKPAQ